MAMAALACAEKTPPPKTAASAPAAAPVAAAAAIPSGPPVEIVPAASARGHLLGSISIGSIDHVFENAARLVGQAVPLPMDAKGLRDMLLSQAGLPPEVAASLDFASPTGAAIVSIGDKGESGTVIAVPAKGPAEAQRVIDALGKPIMVRGPVVLVRSAGSGSGWLYRANNVVVLSDELEALSRGAMLALEARRPGADDITATFFPDAIARAHGTDVKSAIARVLKETREEQGAAGHPIDDRALQPIAELLGLVGDAASAEIGLSADPAKGLVFRARLMSKPGTRLESVAREVKPFELDPAVTGDKASRFLVGASSLGAFWRGTFATYRERLAADKEKGAAAALAYFDATLAALGGQTSGAMWLRKEEPHLVGVFASPAKDKASAASLVTAMNKLDAAAVSAFVRAQIGESKAFDITAKKETVGKVKALHYRFKVKKTGAADNDVLRRFLGNELDLFLGVVGTRIVVTLGHDAKGRLVAIGSGKAPAPETSGPLADASAMAKGRDTFYYVDLAPILALAGKLSDEPRLAMLARSGGAPIPIVVTAGGDGVGKVWATDLTVTVSAFSTIGALVAGSMGAGAAH
jgi:hypothetical protein